tara:strand:- start:55 stop:1185 length:1131 start_codon:yes stop_codon:yes gene_type:complete
MRLLSDLDIKKKKVGLRLDLNVPIKDGVVADDTRILASLETLNYLIKAEAKIVIISHLGRPEEGTFDDQLSLRPVASHLGNELGISISLINSMKEFSDTNSQICMLENIRFFEGESKNSDSLAREIGADIDVYVFDAFGTSHRKQASTYGAIKVASNSCAGFLVQREVEALSRALKDFSSPFAVIIGGSKVSTKLEIIQNLGQICDKVITGGGITNTFLAAKGFKVGNSLYEKDMIETAKYLLNDFNIMLPEEVVVSNSFDGPPIKKKISEIEDNEIILDQVISEDIKQFINLSNTIIWNGPLGVFENKNFSEGTEELSKLIGMSDAYTLAGGGETLSAINQFINKEDISYCSTAGGAFLEFIEGKELPSISALSD